MTENALQVFSYKEHKVRTTEIDGEVWFVAKDVADILEIQNIRQNTDDLDEDEKGVCKIYTPGGMQDMTVISESGVYALVFKSRKPEAKQFSRWVRHEVLPTIRKTGSYGYQELNPLNVRAAEVLQKLADMLPARGEQREVVREAIKLVTGIEITIEAPVRPKRNPRSWTAQQVGAALKWPADAVMYRAERLGITKKPSNGYWDGDTWKFSKEGRRKFMELVGRQVVKIEDGYEYYENGEKHIHWSYGD